MQLDQNKPLKPYYERPKYNKTKTINPNWTPGVNNSNLRVWQNMSLASRLVKTSPQTRNP